MARSPESDTSLLRMLPVISELLGVNDPCVGSVVEWRGQQAEVPSTVSQEAK
jgi:hypothetical protein